MAERMVFDDLRKSMGKSLIWAHEPGAVYTRKSELSTTLLLQSLKRRHFEAITREFLPTRLGEEPPGITGALQYPCRSGNFVRHPRWSPGEFSLFPRGCQRTFQLDSVLRPDPRRDLGLSGPIRSCS